MGLFGLGKLTKKVGKRSMTNAYYLQFSKLDGKPTQLLGDALTIGSEEGDFVIKSEGISPRHCTFYLNQDVISIMDHNSIQGSFIGKKKIEPGKMIILQAKDKIYLGDNPLKIISEKMSSADSDELENLEPTGSHDTTNLTEQGAQKSSLGSFSLNTEATDSPGQLQLESSDSEVESKPVIQIKTLSETKNKAKSSSFKKRSSTKDFRFKVARDWGDASNSFVRFVGLSFDMLIVGILMVLLSPMKEALALLDEVLPFIFSAIYRGIAFGQELAGVDVIKKVADFVESTPIIKSIWTDLQAFYANPEYQQFIRFMVLFALIRVFFTLSLGISLGSALAGMTGMGNAVYKRIGGVIREIIGFCTGPFFFFDVPTLFNRRSFKEIITFTKIQTRSPSIAWGLSLISGVTLLSLLFVAPFFKGFTLLKPVYVTPDIKLETFPAEMPKRVTNFSKYLGISLVDGFDKSLIPNYQVLKNGNKTMAHIHVDFVFDKNVISIKPFRDVNWHEMLKIALNLNPLGKKRFPKIDATVHGAGNENANFIADLKDYPLYSNEVLSLTNSALDLSLTSIIKYFKMYGPYLTPMIEYREAFLSLVPPNATIQLMTNTGDSSVFILKSDPKTFYIIPITYPRGKVLEIKMTEELKLEQFKLMLGSIFFDLASENKKGNFNNGKNSNILTFIDTVYYGLIGKEKPEMLQISYEWLFNRIKQDFGEQNEEKIKLWNNSLKGLVKLIEAQGLDKDNTKPAWQKFYQHANDMLKAVEDRDLKFFGLQKGRMA